MNRRTAEVPRRERKPQSQNLDFDPPREGNNALERLSRDQTRNVTPLTCHQHPPAYPQGNVHRHLQIPRKMTGRTSRIQRRGGGARTALLSASSVGLHNVLPLPAARHELFLTNRRSKERKQGTSKNKHNEMLGIKNMLVEATIFQSRKSSLRKSSVRAYRGAASVCLSLSGKAMKLPAGKVVDA